MVYVTVVCLERERERDDRLIVSLSTSDEGVGQHSLCMPKGNAIGIITHESVEVQFTVLSWLLVLATLADGYWWNESNLL